MLAVVCALAISIVGFGAPAGASPSGPEPSGSGPAPVASELEAQVAEAEGERVQALLMLPNLSDFGAPEQVTEELQRHAEQTQTEVLTQVRESDALAGDVSVLNSLWVTNAVLVEFTASAQQLQSLAGLSGVDRVVPNFELSVPEPGPEATTEISAQTVEDRTWGVDKIEAHRVWDELGLTGAGVRVATLDTGVDISHPDLVGKMVTDDPADPTYPGGWMEFDGSGNPVSSEPYDSSDHGTHVSGTIHGGQAGDYHIGVAPDAGMMHGLVIPGGSGSFTQVAAGMQWAIAPTDAEGNPAGEPADVVSMSLGAPGYHDLMIAPAQAIRAAGSVPAFAIGNEDLFGNCGVGTEIGSGSPGNVFESIGVGATDIDDDVAGFSCGEVVDTDADWGDAAPADWPATYVTPDLSAPGVNTYSALPGGDYGRKSGTSMATPHLSGTAALMLSAAPELSVEAIETTMADTAFFDDRHGEERPNTRYGHGRINAFEATAQVAIDSGITGTVTDTDDNPIEGATVTVEATGTEVTTGADGDYTVRLEPGTYDLTITAFGYQDTALTGIEVTADSFTEADATLAPAPTGDIAGTVTLAESGEGIPGATVTVLDIPADLSTTTDADGDYTLADVPTGTWDIQASHPQLGESAIVTVTVINGQTAIADFELALPPETVALVGSYVDQYQELLDARGIESDIFTWDELDETTGYSAIVTGYGFTSSVSEAEFTAWLDATDASGSGIVFTDQAFGSGQGIRQLSEYTGNPESTDSSTGGAGFDTTEYLVTAEHPVLEGFEVGDEVILDSGSGSRWIAWFDGYDDESSQVVADMKRGDTIHGEGIGVQERDNNRHALLSSHGVSITTDPVTDWHEDGKQVFVNAIDWVAPERSPDDPYFVLSDLVVEPDVVMAEEPVSVSVDVTNVGGSAGDYTAVLQVDGEAVDESTVTLDPGETQTVTWEVARDELGTYEVSVGSLTDSFRVRAPVVDLSAHTVTTPGGPAGDPLAGATVELVDDGELVSVGTTDENGELSFEIPDATGEYVVVVRRTAEDGGESYLLHRQVRLLDDTEVVFAPTVYEGPAPEGAPQDVGANFATEVDLAVDEVDDQHGAWTYLRAGATAPFGFGFSAPGSVVASLGDYEAVNVHEVTRTEQDWVLPSEIIGGLEWVHPFHTSFEFGGPAQAVIESVDTSASPQISVDWAVTDGHGHEFATVLATDVRPFVDLPEAVELEQITGLLAGDAPNEQLPILALHGPDGEQIRKGAIEWGQSPFTFTVEDPAEGEYALELEADTGTYSGVVSDQAGFVLGDPGDPGEPTTTRLSGEGRYGTSVQIGQQAYPQADTVVLASGQDGNMVDGLMAAPLGRHLDAPVLLTEVDDVPDVVADDLSDRGVGAVFVVGGEAAVGEDVVTELEAMGITVERYKGANRFGTAAVVAEQVGGDQAVVASGVDGRLVDALGASGPAARVGSPILLVEQDEVPDATADALADYDSTIVTGGEATIDEDVLDDLPDPTRLKGTDRHGTAVAVADHYAGNGVDAGSVSIASSQEANLIDALPGGALGQLMLLTEQNTLPEVTGNWLSENTATGHAHILGGDAAISNDVVNDVEVILTAR